MMKKILLIFLCAASLAATAQSNVFKFNSRGGGFNFFAGVRSIDYGKWYGKDGLGLNESQREWKYSNIRNSETNWAKPGNASMLFGFQGYGVFSSIILGGELNVSIGGKKTQNNKQYFDSTFLGKPGKILQLSDYNTYIRPYSAEVLITTGVIALRTKGLVVYPMIGAGYGATVLRLQDSRDNRNYPELTKTLTNDDNIQNVLIYTRNLVFDVGIGAQYFLGSSNEEKAKGFSVGLRVGYRIQPTSDKLFFNEKSLDIKDADRKLPANGLYAKLILGFGKIGE